MLDQSSERSIARKADTIAGSATFRVRLGAYYNLMKPRVVYLLLLTTIAAMFIAARGVPPLFLIAVTLIGGGLAAGGAAAFNQYLDRDADTMMYRTHRRPIAAGLVTPRQALVFACAVSVIGLGLLFVFANPLTAFLALLGEIHYVLVYTRLLKRITPQNIVIGGAAGAIAPLVGYAAVANTVDLTALYLFAVVFFWTPPHFWALALLIKGEYERAGIPMLPVVRGEEETRRHILLYSIQMVAVTVLLVPARAMGILYLIGALVLGLVFIAYAVKLTRDRSLPSAARLFHFSMLYLALLFTAMVVDRVTSVF